MAKATKKKTSTRSKAKKSPARKTAARKTATRKTAARKTASRKGAAKRTSARKNSAPKPKSKRKPNAAFMRPVKIGSDLQPIVGTSPIPRTEVTKRVWTYIKRNGLQDKKNKRNINADDKLRKVFGGKRSVDMFEMTRLVSRHLS